MVEMPLYLFDLLIRLLRKRTCKVLPDDASPIPYYMIDKKEQQVRNTIEDVEW
jgi:hypothetical protein